MMERYALVNDVDAKVVQIFEWDGDTGKWQPPSGHSARLALNSEFTPAPPPPTDDELIAQQPRKQRLEPTVAAGKAALRDLLDEQVQEAQAWEWFSTKAAADTNLPAAAKTAVAALATAEYERAKRLLAAWRAAT